MRNYLYGFVVALAACGGSSSNSAPIPEGNWDVTLSFTSGNCAGLPPTYLINFDISDVPGGFAFTAGTGLTGDTVGGTMLCTPTLCTLDFTDMGPGAVLSNIDTQTISATLDLTGDDLVSGNGSITFVLTDGSQCTQNFTGDGDVVR